MTEAAVTTYWCHECVHAVDIEEAMAEEIKCPFCDGGFLEEMIGEEFEGLTSQRSERDLSQWGTSDNHFEQPGATVDSEDEDDDDDDMGHEFEGFIRRHRRASVLRQILDRIENDFRTDRVRDPIPINGFNQALAVQGVLDTDEVQDDQGSSNNNDGLLEEHVLGAGLSLLLQYLAETDPNRYGAPPAKKEAIEALPTVKIEEVVSCSVCLDDLELGSQAKQMPCEHKFHSSCIVPWLEIHGSCPVCRFELPSEETRDLSEPSNIIRTESIHEEVRADGPGNDTESSNRGWDVIPWFNRIMSELGPQTARGTSTDQQPPSATGTNLNARDC